MQIPSNAVFWLFTTLAGYIIAAIMWGVRVEMRLAALAREDRAQAEQTARQEQTLKDVASKAQMTHESVIRIEETLKVIKDAVAKR